MPQLPGGRHVGLTEQPVLELAKQGDFKLKLFFPSKVQIPADMAPLICVVYYHAGELDSSPGEPFISDLMLSDIGTEKCNWSKEEVDAFNAWLNTPRSQAFLKKAFDELKMTLDNVKVKLPESLQGVIEPCEVDMMARVLKSWDSGQ